MKKFFSILCAMAIVLSVSAASQFDATAVSQRTVNIEKKAAPANAEMATLSHVQLQKTVAPASVKAAFAAKKDAKVAVNGQLKSAKQLPATVKIQKQLKPAANGAKVKKAPKAAQSVYDITIGQYAMRDYGEGNIYYAVLSDDEHYRFDFDFYLSDNTATDLELGVTYTIDDIGLDYSYGTDQMTEEYIDYAGLSFTKTLADGLVRLDISVIDLDSNIWNMVYQEEPLPVATDTINVVFAADEVELGDYVESSGVFQFIGMNATHIAYIAASTDASIAGSYTNDDMLLNYTGIGMIAAGDTAYLEVLAADMVIAFANDTFVVDAYMLGEDAHCYHAHMSYCQKPFTPTGDTIAVAITEPMSYKYYKTDGDWWLRGENDQYGVNIDLVNHDSISPAGVYTMDDCLKNYTYITDKANDDAKLSLMGFDATVTVADNRIDLVADMLCSDGNVYHITMFYAAPEALYFDTIVADNLEIEEESFYGYVFGYTLIASNAEYEVSISIDSNEDGQYVVDGDGTITNIAAAAASKIYSGTIKLATDSTDGSIKVTGTVLCMNNTQYTLDLTYTVPEAQREETIVANGELNVYASAGAWQAYAVNEAADREIVITVSGDLEARAYSAADLYGGKYYTYVAAINGADTTWYLAASADFTVAIANEVATISGSMIAQQYEGTEVVKFNFTITCAVGEAGTGLEYDEEDADFINDFAAYNIIDTYLADYGLLFLQAQDDANNYLLLELWLPEGAQGLVAGVYPVNATEGEPQTVTASAGVDSEGYVTGSFAGIQGERGLTNVWFIVSGKATVNADGSVDVEAVNSYNRIVRCHLGQAQGVENTNAELNAVKVLRNGQLIIIKNGVEYDALGTVIK